MSTTDIMDMPAMTPPPGVVPNFDDPPNRNTMAVAVMSVCLAVSTIAMVLRFYSRWVVAQVVQWQDYLLLVAFGSYIAMLAMSYRLTSEVGWFVHTWNLRMGDVVDFLHVFVIATYLFLALLVCLKTAILMEWLHIFLPDGGNRRSLFFWACHFVIWANIIFCTVTAIIYSLSCEPYQYIWNHTIEGHCRFSTAYLGLSTACFVFATDIIILFIPQRVIWQLNMSRSRKTGVSFVFALGMAACAASIVRLYYHVVCAGSAEDITYHMSAMMLTGVGECACAILVLCVPAVPKAFTGLKLSGLLPSIITSWGSSSQELRKKKYTGDGAHAWHASAEEVYKRNWQVGSSSERSLVPVEHKSGARHHDLELGNAILCITDFEAKTSYDPDRTVFLEQRSRQHPWMQR